MTLSPRLTVLLSLVTVYFFWGSTLAAMRYADASIPPFIMGAIRFAIAAVLMFAYARSRPGWTAPTRTHWISAAISGFALLLLGNGVVAWSVQYIPTGVVSLLIALTPLWMALFDFLFFRTVLRPRVAGGIALGIIGMGLLVNPFSSGAPALVPALVVVGGSIAWAFGSIYQRHSTVSDDLATTSAMQMGFGSLFLAGTALITGEFHGFAPSAISSASWLGMAWLVIFGSLIAYSAFVWLMRHTSVPLASTYSYVNPIVAIIIGFVLFHEQLNGQALIAAVVILAGVALMLLPEGKSLRATS